MLAFKTSARQSKEGFTGTNTSLEGPVQSDQISYAKLHKGLFINTEVYEFVVDWQHPWFGPILSCRYFVHETKFNQEKWTMELESIGKRMELRVGRSVTRNCPYILADTDCKYVIQAGDQQMACFVLGVFAGFRTKFWFQAPAYGTAYTGGTVTWTSGLNTGVVSQIKNQGGSNQFELWQAPPYPIAVDDYFNARVGCDKTLTLCNSRFANAINFGGFLLVPGIDKSVRGPQVISVTGTAK
jgi:uncharacterized phage protein (TIGR02218 family)